MRATRGECARPALGIEVGSLYVKAVETDGCGAITWQLKERSCGEAAGVIAACRARAAARDLPIGIVRRGAGDDDGCLPVDPVVGLAAGVRALFPDARNIVEAGGSTLTLVHLDEAARILSVHRNSLCAAGTGSFLDEQAARLNIDRDAGGDPSGDAPGIATRCAVFAKSDLIHRQQEGWAPGAVWSGLCRGLAENVLNTLTYGRPLAGVTVLCGGVALDRSFVSWFARALAARNGNGHHPVLHVAPAPEYVMALGAALVAGRTAGPERARPAAGERPPVTAGRQQRPPLALLRSRYPAATAVAGYMDAEGNEVTLHAPAPDAGGDVVLGLDIGSTSTKCALVGMDGRLRLDVYRRTEGDPIGATRKLLNAVTAAGRRFDLRFDVGGAATTGSGRKLVGTVFGADLVVNEISAHAAGALRLQPDVETIFEIGGQDAKYIAVRNGRVTDANMNYVCAAGTGSFVEEVAAKLGHTVQEVGDLVLGVSPPYTSSRCTVFMEQDVLNLLRRGASRREALGAVLYSVVENYLERVVGRRAVSRDRIFFQGATARNRGLVAAIENLLGVEVVVSPCCHVMGAYGAALLALPAAAGAAATRFRGLSLGSREIGLTQETCELCVNRCRLTRAAIEGVAERPAWGMVCGRDERETKMRVPRESALMRARTRLATRPARPERAAPGAAPATAPSHRIGLPLALSTFTFLPFWTAFFRAIGMDVVAGEVSDQACLALSRERAAPEVCLPLKAAHGQVSRLASRADVDAVFLPHLVAERPTAGVRGSKFCPYVEAAPTLVRAALAGGEAPARPILAPVIDLTLSDARNAAELQAALGVLRPLDARRIEQALADAHAALERQRETLLKMGRETVARATRAGKPVVVLVGRPYNTLDPAISLDVPHHVADCGVDVVPMDCLPFEPERLSGELRHMFWHYGQRILSVLARVAATDGFYALYLTSFGCGPDSFLLNYAEAIMGDKPFLTLELDEHGSSGGYHTRIEAFLDVIRSDFAVRQRAAGSRPEALPPRAAPGPAPARRSWRADEDPAAGEDWRSRTLWIPPMHVPGQRLFAAALRGLGIDARPLTPEDDEAYALGKRLTRGGECMPCPLTIGSFVKQMQADGNGDAWDTSAFFMPTTCGPCRFGQYRTLARLVFDRLGHPDVPVLSPTQDSGTFDFDTTTRTRLWEAVLASDILFKMRCRVRPYQAAAGDAEALLERWTVRLERAFTAGPVDWRQILGEAAREFSRIPRHTRPAPLVGIVGEIYLRSNVYANSHLIEAIENLGGEAWLAPMGEWVEYCSWIERFRERLAGASWRARLKLALTWYYTIGRAHRMYRWAGPLLADRLEPEIDRVMDAGGRFLPPQFEGESIISLGRAVLFGEQGADLVINCAPFNCMQGNITTAIFERLGERLPAPVVNVFYDGVEDNAALATFLHQAAERARTRTG